MKLLKKVCVRPGSRGPKIRCSTTDALVQFPTSSAFIFDRTLDHDALEASLALVLRDYPLFAGSFKREGGQLFLDCDERGVQFEVVQREETLDRVLRSLLTSERKRLAPKIRFGMGKRSGVLDVRISQFRGGGSVLAVCWYHAVGDWLTLMHFMKAWSAATTGHAIEAPVIVLDRHAYTQEHCHEVQSSAGMRLVGFGELAKCGLFLALQAFREQTLMFHFSDQETADMRDDLQQRAASKLSMNETLVAHLLSVINQADPRVDPRQLSFSVNWRRRGEIPDMTLGNFIDTVSVPCDQAAKPEQLAVRLRRAAIDWKPRYPSVTEFLQQSGGASKWYRLMPTDMDFLRGTALSNLRGCGISELTFGMQAPSLVLPSPVQPVRFPWFAMINEGYENQGTQVMFSMPARVAKRLREPQLLAELHRYRGAPPAGTTQKRLPWLM